MNLRNKAEVAGSHWKHHATQWAKVGSPLRPVAEDRRLYWQAVEASLDVAAFPAVRALLLGVTPELAALPWPGAAQMVACDSSLDMVRRVWPQNGFPGAFASAVNADWRALPLATARCDLAIGDGCFSVLPDSGSYRRCAQELGRVLRAGGGLVLRLFCPPPIAESAQQVLADLHRGDVGNFHAFKWRLVMAVHAGDAGACLHDVWNVWSRAFPEPDAVAALSGWSLEAIGTLEAYRNATARYSFFSLDQVRDLLSPEFEFLQVLRPSYELGDRCPIVSLRSRP